MELPHSFMYDSDVEPTIPEGMTIAEWNKQRRLEIQNQKRARFHRHSHLDLVTGKVSRLIPHHSSGINK
jgi:hypothetical protein